MSNLWNHINKHKEVLTSIATWTCWHRGDLLFTLYIVLTDIPCPFMISTSCIFWLLLSITVSLPYLAAHQFKQQFSDPRSITLFMSKNRWWALAHQPFCNISVSCSHSTVLEMGTLMLVVALVSPPDHHHHVFTQPILLNRLSFS